MKKVIYNGGTESYFSCSEPTNLVVGKIYEVVHENDIDWQTNYYLKGVPGEFNSVWFNEVSNFNTYFAISNELPVVGKSCKCNKLELNKNIVEMQELNTETVLSVELLGKNTYKAFTQNGIYLITVM